MTDRAAMLAAILAAPEDDAPRLVYADWLDEHGEGFWAATIRMLANPKFLPSWQEMWVPECDVIWMEPYFGGPDQVLRLTNLVDARKLQYRFSPDGYLLWRRWRVWAEFRRRFPGNAQVGLRGFVEYLNCTAADWLTHGDAILAEHPVREVRLTTRFRLESDGPSVWFANDKARFSVAAVAAAAASRDRDVDLAIAEARWPGIAFALPERQAYRQADFTPLFTGDPTSDA